MNLRLLLVFTGVGIALGLLTVSIIVPPVDFYVWLFTYLTIATVLALKTTTRHFLVGFLGALIICLVSAIIHALLIDSYFIHHELEIIAMEMMNTLDNRINLLLLGLAIGVFSGCFLGLMTWFVHKVLSNKNPSV